jgi:tRNA(fMet)-specific endonuclease VapC
LIQSVVADTDVLSFMFKHDSRAELYRAHIDRKLVIISFMTIAELDRWALHHNWAEPRRQSLEAFLEDFLFSFCDRSLCLKWAEATDSARRKGRPIETADAWVAATSLLHAIPLVTHNRSNYLGVDGLQLISETT